jgi:hypothetical protein
MDNKEFKYAWLLKRIAIAARNGNMEKAKRLFDKAWKHQNEMNNVEFSVLSGQWNMFYENKYKNFIGPEKADYYENRILSRQENFYD